MSNKYETVTDFGREFRKEIAPLLNSKGFDIKLSTSKRSYHYDGNVNIKITKVPTNFPVWTSEYNRWDTTDNAKKLLETIENRVEVKLSGGLDIRLELEYGNNIPYIKYKKPTENENE